MVYLPRNSRYRLWEKRVGPYHAFLVDSIFERIRRLPDARTIAPGGVPFSLAANLRCSKDLLTGDHIHIWLQFVLVDVGHFTRTFPHITNDVFIALQFERRGTFSDVAAHSPVGDVFLIVLVEERLQAPFSAGSNSSR